MKNNIFKFGIDSWKYPINWLRNIKQFFRNFKFAYQRATRGFADCDTWNLDSYYSELFYQTLRHLAKNTHGYPATEEFNDTNAFKEGYEDKEFGCHGAAKWEATLNEMAEHFLNTQEWNEDLSINQEVTSKYELIDEYLSKGGKPFDEEYIKLHKEWMDISNKADEFRKKEKDIAFDMMKKYFYDL